jgi:hypothetical protein
MTQFEEKASASRIDLSQRPITPTPQLSPSLAPEPRVTRSQPFSLPVLLCGLATTALTLLAVYILDRLAPGFNIMGWYANKILPIGAIIVGVAACSGYGIAAWFSGLKISGRLVLTIFALQTCAYFGAQYIQFHGLHLIHDDTNTAVGFWEYFDLMARSFAWKQHDGTHGEALGVFGYFFRVIEILGFSVGGLIVPIAMHSNPYCEKCLRYKRTRQLVYIPASIPIKRISKKDTAAAEAQNVELQKAMDSGKQRVESLQTLATAGNLDAFKSEIAAIKAEKTASSLPSRYLLELVHCPTCRDGHLKTSLLEGQGNQVKRTETGATPLTPDFVQLIRPK